VHAEIIIAGFGGQGALFAGQMLAYAAMDNGFHVTWIPSYGPEMRGGTANCTVIVSDDEIGSPLVRHPSAVIALNRPAVDKYEPLVAPGGVLIVNANLAECQSDRQDINVIGIAANSLAEQAGHVRYANVVMTGALLAATGIMPVEALERALAEHLPEHHRRALEANHRALRLGAEAAQPAAAG
jgi:2-oxoglutarate ferredoxin oxidoreductase subunit gamma